MRGAGHARGPRTEGWDHLIAVGIVDLHAAGGGAEGEVGRVLLEEQSLRLITIAAQNLSGGRG